MNKPKIDVYKLENKDVISTSAEIVHYGNCKTAKGFAYDSGSWHFSVNNGNSKGGAILPVGWIPDSTKIYHTDEYGNILNELCPCQSENEARDSNHHNAQLGV